MVIHGNLYAGVTLVSIKQKQIKTIECYEPIHVHNSYFNLMGHGAPATTRATISRSYLPVSTARAMAGHPLTASTGARPSIKLQRPDPVTGGRPTINQAAKTRPCDGGGGTNSGHAATCPITDNSVTYSHQCILFQQQSYFRRCKHKTFHCLFISNIEVGTEWRRLLCSHQLVVLEHPSWRRPILNEVVSI